MLERFFDKKNTFNKRTKKKGPVITEEIEASSSDNADDNYMPIAQRKQ